MHPDGCEITEYAGPTHHRTAAPAAARSGADASALADLLKSLGARLDGFGHRAFADLVADAGRFKIFDNGLLAGL